MSNYTQTTFFTPKDSLPTNNPAKTIFGAAYDVEFAAISTAIASKANLTTPAFIGPVTIASGGGLTLGAPTGGDQGVGTINIATAYYVNAVPLYPGAPVTAFGSSNPTINLASANSSFVSSASGLTITIPANSSIAFPTGTMLTFQNNGGGTMTIAITTDTLQMAGTTNTGSRSLLANGLATAIKVTSTKWIISGAGLT